jgi:23S rRNA pseudouridine1911/1915/1917 synthase
MNHPIVGDPLYSRARRLPMALPGQALHDAELGLSHPISGERLLFQAPMPADFAKLLRLLRSRNRHPNPVPSRP